MKFIRHVHVTHSLSWSGELLVSKRCSIYGLQAIIYWRISTSVRSNYRNSMENETSVRNNYRNSMENETILL